MNNPLFCLLWRARADVVARNVWRLIAFFQ